MPNWTQRCKLGQRPASVNSPKSQNKLEVLLAFQLPVQILQCAMVQKQLQTLTTRMNVTVFQGHLLYGYWNLNFI